jgi:predicted polyphosphate/ATP-dependent NAD kinase
MNASSSLKRTSGTTDPQLPAVRLPKTSSTLHVSNRRIVADAAIAVSPSEVVEEAEAIIEDARIRANYTLVPKRTIDDLVRTYETSMLRRQPRKVADIDLPMMDEDSDW